MIHRIRKPTLLIFAIAAAQAVLLTAGVLSFSAWMKSTVSQIVYQQVIDDNIHTARQVIGLVKLMDADDLRENPATWQRVQSVIGKIELPNDGFVCLIDVRDGHVLNHPDFNGLDAPTPMLAPTPQSPGTLHTTAPTRDGSPEITGVVRDHQDQLHIIAAARVSGLDVKISVHQNVAGVDTRIERLIAPVVPAGIAISVLLIGLTSAAIALIMRSYDNRLARINDGLEDTVRQRTRALRKTRDAVVFGLAKLADSRDPDTGEHLERIRHYVTLLAKQLKKNHATWIDSAYIENLAVASSLHDIGKVGVADAVLLKRGGLTDDERTQIQDHPTIGGECLKAIGEQLGDDDFLQLSREIAYGHHERWDGSGYPAKAQGEAIPFAARIISVADVYDALRSRRPYKEPFTHAQARDIVVKGRGTHFDPAVVDAFVACESDFQKLADRHLANPA